MRLPGLDSLRAVAVLWTMLFHSFLVGGLGEDFAWLQRYGWMGVDLFFVLSGFLIGVSVLEPLAQGRGLSMREFYLRRAFRILPAFGAVLALYVLWPGFREAPGMEPWWKFAGFFVNLSIDYEHNAAFSHAWSLCVEEHFYLLFPALALAFYRWGSRVSLGAFALLLLVGGVALRAAIWRHFEALDPERSWYIERLYYPTWCRLDGLLDGVLLAVARTWRPQAWGSLGARANGVAAAGFAAMGLSFWLFAERSGLLGNTLGWPVLSFGLALLVFAAAQPKGVLARAFPGAAWLAGISYSLYLVHKPVYGLVQRSWGAALEGQGLWAFLAYGVASLAAGALLHALVEGPGLRLRRRLLRA